MSLPSEYEAFLDSHNNPEQVFSHFGRHWRLCTKRELHERVDVDGRMVPFSACLVVYRKYFASLGADGTDLRRMSGFAIGEYAGDILFISHINDAIYALSSDGEIDKEASSAASFFANLEKVNDTEKTEGEPGATDNPDDAQRLREDY